MKIHVRALFVLSSFLLAHTSAHATVVEEQFFKLDLPGEWVAEPQDDPGTYQYHAAKGEESVTVGLLFRNPDHPVPLEHDMKAVLKHRRDVEASLPKTPVALTEPVVAEKRGALVASWFGNDAAHDRRTFTVVIVNGTVVGSFYYETFGLSSRAFEPRAREVLSHVGLISK